MIQLLFWHLRDVNIVCTLTVATAHDQRHAMSPVGHELRQVAKILN